ncbi:MAG TPA: hypothetical protein VET83_08135 [Candidatus Dormibacteraeota bacterium]|nr:hypothetical protein [Candidatus Dormibacteraeota bacterium]
MPGARPRPARSKKRRLWRWALAVAAIVAWLVVLAGLNQAPPWTALPSAGSGNVIVNGVSVPVRDFHKLTSRLGPGARVRLESDQDLDILSSGVLGLQLTPGTEAVLPAAPGRWFGRSGVARVDRGSLRVTTGLRFDGAHLAIITPDATVRLTGTTVAVIAEPGGTCVCVLDGTADVKASRGGVVHVPAGTRCDIARNGNKAPREGEIRGAERPKLQDLRDRLQAVMN